MKEKLVEYWLNNNIIKDKKLIEAFLAIPREKFIREENLDEVYGDYPLPIGYGQTISQPSTVMIMIQALELKKGDKVLEIGTGSGWNAALIAHVIGNEGKVYTTEIIGELALFAKENLKKLNINNVEVLAIDGSVGYKKQAPYNKIIVTAACPDIPKPLLKQLKMNGILIAPVESFLCQKMVKITKLKHDFKKENLGAFSFVPLKGKYGY